MPFNIKFFGINEQNVTPRMHNITQRSTCCACTTTEWSLLPHLHNAVKWSLFSHIHTSLQNEVLFTPCCHNTMKQSVYFMYTHNKAQFVYFMNTRYKTMYVWIIYTHYKAKSVYLMDKHYEVKPIYLIYTL